MILGEGRAALVGRPARLAFRTTHIDRAGETSSVRVVDAEVVDLDAAGGALLVTADGLHLRLPAAALHPTPAGVIGGQELVRDFHSAADPVTLRWPDRAAVERDLAAAAPPAGRARRGS